jgi:hypothetical protein
MPLSIGDQKRITALFYGVGPGGKHLVTGLKLKRDVRPQRRSLSVKRKVHKKNRPDESCSNRIKDIL